MGCGQVLTEIRGKSITCVWNKALALHCLRMDQISRKRTVIDFSPKFDPTSSPSKTIHVTLPAAPNSKNEDSTLNAPVNPTSSPISPPSPPPAGAASAVYEATCSSQIYISRRHKIHETLHTVQKSHADLSHKLNELESMSSRIELGFHPALEQMVLDDERLRSDLDRRRAITEKLIRNEIESEQAPIKQHRRLLQQQLVSVQQCEEIVKHVLKLEKPYMIRAFPRVEIEAKQVLETYEAMGKLEMPTAGVVTPDMFPKSYLSDLQLTVKSKKKGKADSLDWLDPELKKPPTPVKKSKKKPQEEMESEIKEKDEVILQLIKTVEKLEVLADLKKEAKSFEEAQAKATEDVKALIREGKKRNAMSNLDGIKTGGGGPALALSGVNGGLEAARKFEREVMKASTQESFMQPTMSNYAKQRFALR